MERYCNNCGAALNPENNFCSECGSKIEKDIINYCPECGNPLGASENFCENCGYALKKENAIEKYKVPIIIALAVIILIIAGALLTSQNSSPSTVDLPPQTVTVGAEYFKIPAEFALSAEPLDIKSDYGAIAFSQSFTHGPETINIAVLSSSADIDLEGVVSSQGGVHKTMMGYDGYYNEFDVYDYSFSFVKGDKICVIETTSPYLFDEIEVL